MACRVLKTLGLIKKQLIPKRRVPICSDVSTSMSQRGTKTTAVLYQLCDKCDRVFQPEHKLTKDDIHEVTRLLGSIPLTELGLAAPEPSTNDPPSDKPPKWAPPITYLDIHACKNYTIGIFCLPKHATIPLHNHPGMMVFSRVLYGDMRVEAYDFVTDNKTDENVKLSKNQRLVEPVNNRIKSAGETPSVIFPESGGNIHAFKAVSDCAVLDVLSPPYSTEEGRDCLYFQDISSSIEGLKSDKFRVLETYEPPMDFVVLQGHYTGLDVSKRPGGAGSSASGTGSSKASKLPAESAFDNGETGERLEALKI